MISINDQRVLSYNSGTTAWVDLTKELSDKSTAGTSVTLSSTQFLYLGSFLPFNHKYFRLSAVNAVLAGLTIEVFDGTAWVSTLETFDYTETAGAPFAASGIIQFNKDRDEPWGFISDTSENGYLPEFTNYSAAIYDKFWLRISASTAISMTIDYIGHLFCSDTELFQEYPILSASQILNSWQSGKTDWVDQEIIASEYVLTELKNRNIILERSQVVERAVLVQPAIYATARMIFSGLGAKNYEPEIKLASERYIASMNLTKFEQDANGDGEKDRHEQAITTHRVSR